jgi:hypothetical protein
VSNVKESGNNVMRVEDSAPEEITSRGNKCKEFGKYIK